MNVVFVHGAGSSSKVWSFQRRYFSLHHVVTVDLPGHGEPKGEGRETIADYVEDVRQTIKDSESPVVVGHSMGGAITMMYALKYSVRACILAGTGARLRVFPAVLENIRRNHEGTVDFILENAIYHKTEEIMRHSKEEMLAISPEVTYKDFLACDQFDIMQEVKNIGVPTLVVCGDQDRLTPVKYSEYLRTAIPNSRLEVIKDCGHMLMLERPQEFNIILDSFLKDL